MVKVGEVNHGIEVDEVGEVVGAGEIGEVGEFG